MSDSSDNELSDDYVPYRNREEWADVTPLEQDDGENPVVEIAYSDKFRDIYDYFRAVVASSEKSLRALDLTRDALKLNAANYTVWQYRRDILRALNLDLFTELDYVENIIENNSKNYQVWHHRRVIVELLDDPSHELELTENILDMDAKNYHAWQHRQWVIKAYNLFDDELTYVDRLISEDMRNNSAWNQRFFVLKHTGITPDVMERELNYVMNRIRIIKNNESPWNFLRGILQHDNGTLNQFPQVNEFCEELYNSGNRSRYLLAFLIDLYEERCLQQQADLIAVGDNEQYSREELSQKVLQLCDQMAKDHDKIREKYWVYVADMFKSKLNAAPTTTATTPDVAESLGDDVKSNDGNSEDL